MISPSVARPGRSRCRSTSTALTISPIGDERVGFSAATDINREDFGLTWNMALETGGLLVGKNARIELSVEAIAASQAARRLTRSFSERS